MARIVEFQAENIKKLKVVVIKPTGPLVQLTGGNGEGKTSVLDSILYALAGTEDLPSQPIRRGADKGAILIDLGDYKVLRKFTPSGNVLIVEGKNGARFQKPQQMLDAMFGNLSFDPLAFTRMKPKDQGDQLRSLVQLDVDPNAIDTLNREDYETRTGVNREVKRLEAQIAGISVVGELPADPIDVTGLIAELEQAGTKNAQISSSIVVRTGVLNRIVQYRADAQELLDKAARLRLEADQEEAKAKAKYDAADADEKQIAATPIAQPIDTQELREQIENARATNAQISKRTEKETLQAALAEQTKRAESLTEAIKGREAEKAQAIAKANMPVEGLGFENGEVMYNGLPFNQASGAEQLRVSCAIAMASNPEVRIIRITDGSLLDDKSLEIIKKMAIARDYQIWIERVDTSGKIGIVMEDGEVKTVNEDEEPEAEEVPSAPPAKAAKVAKKKGA